MKKLSGGRVASPSTFRAHHNALQYSGRSRSRPCGRRVRARRTRPARAAPAVTPVKISIQAFRVVFATSFVVIEPTPTGGVLDWAARKVTTREYNPEHIYLSRD
ncbi:hypothetical protein EVAR_67491_1 [Eumeta japonica]|uniref:Uncharacterized protein n=1 Tax=Eumeta variegata TaxID=151549 RepID=A0A4C1ZCE0_EUMVA|nr:hypothetical protein EVAR_67491_1 [Eumeta japonica]